MQTQLNWTQDQITALEIIDKAYQKKQKEIVLSGNAGTGKTTIVKEIIKKYASKVLLLAPTAKAALRLKEVTDTQAHTIHSVLYETVIENEDGELIFLSPQQITQRKSLVIIDEASMLGTKLKQDILANIPEETRVLFVGDFFQLPPVKDKSGVDLVNPDAKLLNIHRQSMQNPIIPFTLKIREGKWLDWLKTYDNSNDHLLKFSSKETLVNNFVTDYKQGTDTICLCYTHASRTQLNQQIRNELGFTKRLEANDQLIVKSNNKACGIFNGEIITIQSLKYYKSAQFGTYALIKIKEKKTPFKIALNTFGMDSTDYRAWTQLHRGKLHNNFIHCDYGYAITIHSSQGSQWNTVHYYYEPTQHKLFPSEINNKMLYTGCTRATTNLRLYS